MHAILMRMAERREVHIDRYEASGNGGYPSPVFRAGFGFDAIPPTPLTKGERNARWAERRANGQIKPTRRIPTDPAAAWLRNPIEIDHA